VTPAASGAGARGATRTRTPKVPSAPAARKRGLAPVLARDARVLILGSFPGEASLAARQYYAHPRNHFWRIVEATLGIASNLPYGTRCARLAAHGVALWDVLKACVREGSLDSSIVEASIVANDFASFLASHARIGAIYFNGAKAQQTYARHVLPHLPPALAAIPLTRLPSTSPANASMSFEYKLARWRVIRVAQPRPAGRSARR
jgi:TDG/mug DNA glycosylase family protein